MTITATNKLPAFDHFIQQLRHVWASTSDVETRMKRAEALLRVMLADSAIIAHSKQWPWTPGQNLLLYEDPDHHFVINATVRKPGSKGAVHDHGHSWTLYGLVEGTERIERYTRLDDGKRAGHAELKLIADREMEPGGVDFVPPYEVHAERGGPERWLLFECGPHVGAIGRADHHAMAVGAVATSEHTGRQHVGQTIAQDVRWHAKLGIRKALILAVAFDLEFGACRQHVNAQPLGELAQPREPSILPLPHRQRRPQRPNARGLLSGDELGQSVGVDIRRMDSEPCDEHREHAQVAALHRLDRREQQRILDVGLAQRHLHREDHADPGHRRV